MSFNGASFNVTFVHVWYIMRQHAGVVKRRGYEAWDYWSRPVPSLGDPEAKVMAIGLAPAAHGGNRTSRIFTGDASARFLMEVLCETGLQTSHFQSTGTAACSFVTFT